jgi:hypothetical protein
MSKKTVRKIGTRGEEERFAMKKIRENEIKRQRYLTITGK